MLLTEQRTEQLISVLWLQIHKHIKVGLLQEQAVASREQELYIYIFFFCPNIFSYDMLLCWADCSFSREKTVSGFLKDFRVVQSGGNTTSCD